MDIVRCKETQHDTRLNMRTFFCCFWLYCMLTTFVCLCGQPADCCCARHQSRYRPGVLLQKGIGLGLAAVTSHPTVLRRSTLVLSYAKLLTQEGGERRRGSAMVSTGSQGASQWWRGGPSLEPGPEFCHGRGSQGLRCS